MQVSLDRDFRRARHHHDAAGIATNTRFSLARAGNEALGRPAVVSGWCYLLALHHAGEAPAALLGSGLLAWELDLAQQLADDEGLEAAPPHFGAAF